MDGPHSSPRTSLQSRRKLSLALPQRFSDNCANALPIWKSLYTDPQVIETAGEEVVAASQIQFDFIENRPMVPYYNELSTSMQTEIQLVLLGQKTAQEALEQIDDKGYAIPYQTDGRTIVKVGVKFNVDTRIPEDWVIQQ